MYGALTESEKLENIRVIKFRELSEKIINLQNSQTQLVSHILELRRTSSLHLIRNEFSDLTCLCNQILTLLEEIQNV